MTITNPNYISYKDTAARVFIKEGIYYRYIFNEYQAEYDHLMQSGLYAELLAKELIISHVELKDTEKVKVEEGEAGNTKVVYCLLKPAQITFQSYPFEWSYTQWRKAIIAYLQINQIALQYGMILKDATPFNFYLQAGKAILLDTSSFSFFKDGQPWIAYRQFCSEFFSPIALIHYNGQKWSRITLTHLRGLPLNFVSKQLTLKSWFNSSVFLHIHLHAKYANIAGSTTGVKKVLAQKGRSSNSKNKINQQKGFSNEKLQFLMSTLLATVKKWETPYQFDKHWHGYYENDIASERYLADKEQIIKKWLQELQPSSVLDLGANTGKFSFLAADYTKKVIALESDDICVDIMEAEIKSKKLKHVHILMQDLAETTPNMGLAEKEIASIFTRAKSEMVMALAVEHHLNISNQISFHQFSELFSTFSSKYLITEFVPASDPKVQLMVKDKQIDLSSYTLDSFQTALKNHFYIIEQKELSESDRKLILLQKK